MFSKYLCISLFFFGIIVALKDVCLTTMGKKVKVKIKAKYLAKIKKPEDREEKVIETSPSFEIEFRDKVKIKLFQPVESFEY